MTRNIIAIIIACVIICAVAIGFVIVYGGTDTENIPDEKPSHTESPAAQPTSTPSYTAPTVPPTQNPVQPSAEPTQNIYQITDTPTPTFTLSPTPAPSPTQIPSTVSPAAVPDKAGSSLLCGNWYGSKSLFFGMASATFYLTADSKGNMKISGTADAPSAGYNNAPFLIDAEWTYLGGNSFVGLAGDNEIPFTCDGNRISLTANPYKLGLIDNGIANTNIAIEMART